MRLLALKTMRSTFIIIIMAAVPNIIVQGQSEAEQKTRIDTVKELARFLEVLGNKVEGRGVPKAD